MLEGADHHTEGAITGGTTAVRAVLAIGAHPDDIELGCGGSLSRFIAEGVAVRALIMSRGRRGALSEDDRARETHEALGLLGITDVHVYDFPDTQLWRLVSEMVHVIEQHVRTFAPMRAYTMFQHDRHQDHRAVYEASAIACRAVPQLLGYETPSSYPNFMPTVFADIGPQLDAKLAALKRHTSQGKRLYMQEEKVRAAALFRGAQVSTGPAEGFVPYKLMI